jgi:hypothetical protein
VITNGAIGSKTAARPGGIGRAAPHAAKMSQPWTVIFDRSGHRDHAHGQLTVPDGDPAPGRPSRGAAAQQSGGLPRSRGTGPARARRNPAPAQG